MPSATLSRKSQSQDELEERSNLLAAAERSACHKRYSDFFKCAWHAIEPNDELVWNWHLDYLCGIYQAEIERIASKDPRADDTDLIVNIPPRSLKSNTTTVFLNAWAWTRWPHLKFIAASFSPSLAHDLSRKTMRLLESQWYRSLWPEVRIRYDRHGVAAFENTAGGFRKSVSVGSSLALGQGGDVIIADDPTDPKQAFSEPMLKRARDWWDQTYQNRLNDHHVGLRIIVMQRLHENDLTGYVLSKGNEKWRHIRIPGEDSYPISPPDLERNYSKGLFFPERFTRLDLAQFRKDYTSIGYANQIGQAPAPVEGAIYRKKWFKRFDKLPAGVEWSMQSWDLTFKKEGTSRVCGQVWASDGVKHFVKPVVCEKLGFVETKKAILRTSEEHPTAYGKLIEAKANGPAIIDDLERQVPGLIPVEKSKSKIENAQAASVAYEAGNVFVLEGEEGDAFIEEHLQFPRGKYDDQVDTANQYLIHAMESVFYAPVEIDSIRDERVY